MALPKLSAQPITNAAMAADDLQRDIRRALQDHPDILLDVPAWYLDFKMLAERLVELGWRRP